MKDRNRVLGTCSTLKMEDELLLQQSAGAREVMLLVWM